LDPDFAKEKGGRWNPPNSWPTLYLNRDIQTARAQIERMLDGTFSNLDDLSDDAFDLVAATLPRKLEALDLISPAGIGASGLPATYPLNAKGDFVPHSHCQVLSVRAHTEELDGVEAPAAVRAPHDCFEFAWWPRNATARPYGNRLPYGLWRSALIVDAQDLFNSR
jgi:RES domain-containing protein